MGGSAADLRTAGSRIQFEELPQESWATGGKLHTELFGSGGVSGVQGPTVLHAPGSWSYRAARKASSQVWVAALHRSTSDRQGAQVAVSHHAGENPR